MEMGQSWNAQAGGLGVNRWDLGDDHDVGDIAERVLCEMSAQECCGEE